jgi:hypothetical protein
MKILANWRDEVRLRFKHRRIASSTTADDLIRFFEQAFRHAQEPSACWFGFHQGRVSLVIGNYYLAALGRKGIWILVDTTAPFISGFKVEPTSRSRLKWLFTPTFSLPKNLLENPALWASYSRASRLALDSPDGRPRKESFYRKHRKVRLSDIWPEPGRGDLFQELENQAPTLKALSKTEFEAVRLSRIGQGRFRDSQLALWAGCAVTRCKTTRILRASHLKPWAASTNKERLDPYNGLLLVPNLDAALDAGLITFGDDGKILFSSQLDFGDALSLGIKPTMKISTVYKRNLKYLRYHKQYVFIK